MLSLVIPTYNEEKNIAKLLDRIEFSLKNVKHEVIIVDDGTDKTAALALKIAKIKRYPVIVYKRKRKKGLTSATLDGIKKARGNLIGVIDADLQYSPELLPKLLAEIAKGNDIAIASRYVKGGGSSVTACRKFISKAGVFAIHLFAPKTRAVKDPLTNFIIFKKEIAKNINPDAMRLLPELLIKEKVKKVVEIPCQFNLRKAGKTKIPRYKNILAGLGYSLKLGKKTGELARMARFLIVGASGIIINEGLLWFLTDFAGFFYLISSLIAIEASILSNFALNDIWTFRDSRKGNFFNRMIKFNVARAATSAINIGILFLLTTLGMHYLISNLIGIAVATIIGYSASLFWVWK